MFQWFSAWLMLFANCSNTTFCECGVDELCALLCECVKCLWNVYADDICFCSLLRLELLLPYSPLFSYARHRIIISIHPQLHAKHPRHNQTIHTTRRRKLLCVLAYFLFLVPRFSVCCAKKSHSRAMNSSISEPRKSIFRNKEQSELRKKSHELKRKREGEKNDWKTEERNQQ